MAMPTSLERGELWSWLRTVLSQGGDIWLDHQGKGYEQYSARLDAAARERADELGTALAATSGEEQAATHALVLLQLIKDESLGIPSREEETALAWLRQVAGQ